VSTGKTSSVPDSFSSSGLSQRSGVRSGGLDSILMFLRWIPEPPHPEAIRSVTHLVLARGLSDGARLLFEPKGEPNARSLPPVRFSLGLCFLCPGVEPVKLLPSAPNPTIAGSGKLSVPGRVHSVLMNFGSLLVIWGRSVQPVMDSRHGRIAFPTFSPGAVLNGWRTAASNQSSGLSVQPLSRVDGGSRKVHAASFFCASSGNIRVSS
jgi:hypothetical protein